MRGLLLIIQFLTAIFLVVAVLLHSAKGEGLGGIGGSAKLFGSPKGLEKGLDTVTWGGVIIFFFVSIVLAVLKF